MDFINFLKFIVITRDDGIIYYIIIIMYVYKFYYGFHAFFFLIWDLITVL